MENVGKGGYCTFDLDGFKIDTSANGALLEDSKTVFVGLYNELLEAIKTGKPIVFSNVSFYIETSDDPVEYALASKIGVPSFVLHVESENLFTVQIFSTSYNVDATDTISLSD